MIVYLRPCGSHLGTANSLIMAEPVILYKCRLAAPDSFCVSAGMRAYKLVAHKYDVYVPSNRML